jgi:serine/threonine protein kinase
LRQEPELSSAFVALTDAYRRANLIDAQLQTTINADIVEVTTPMNLTMVRNVPANMTRVRTLEAERPSPGWVDDFSAANSTNLNTAPGWQTRPPAAVKGTAPATATGSTVGSTWDVAEGSCEVGAPLYPGSVIRERFVLVEELGRGGMGVVYKAFDRSRGDMKDRYVALKVLNEEFKRHPLAVKSLQREARKAQKLAHPNIVAVHDFDRDGGNVYMVMECLSGRSLDQVLREDGQGGIPLVPALEIVGALASALSYAHAQDIVHCDFKPSNAFLCSDGKVKVLDFGIARAAPSLAVKGDTTLFDAGQLGAISPVYASLELLQREQPDVRDDVYSFACVVYELLTGCHPYQRLDAAKACQMGLQPRPVRKLTRGQWRALKQGLAFRRNDRSPSVDVLARELIAPQRRTGLWVGLGAAAVVAAAVAGGVVSQWQDVKHYLVQYLSERHGQKVSTAATDTRPATTSAGVPAQARPEPPPPAPADSLPTTAPDPRTTPPVTNPGKLTAVLPPAQTTQQSAGEPQAAPAAPAPVKPAPATGATAAPSGGEQKLAGIEMLREQFETEAASGDIAGALIRAKALKRASPGSNYVTQEVPRILALSYIHLAKSQFAAGQVVESLQTIADARNNNPKSVELRDLHVRYTAAANIYDRLRYAVTLNVADMQGFLDQLKSSEGEEYDAAAQMLAQTLADRIADQRAANRETVANQLLEAGKQIFPGFVGILGRGRPGALPDTPIVVTDP